MALTNTATTDSPSINDETIEEVAAEACVHPRTIERRLLRLPIKGRALTERADAALARRGLIRRDSNPPNSAR